MSKPTNVTPVLVDLVKFLCIFSSAILFISGIVTNGDNREISRLYFLLIPSVWLLGIMLATCFYVMAACQAILRTEKRTTPPPTPPR